MKIHQLIGELELAEDDDEVVFVSQPGSHPLVYRIREVIQGSDGRWYVIEGSQEGYATDDIRMFL